MAPKYKDKDGGVVLSFGGQWVSWAHTAVAYTAFLSALVVGVALHYRKIVQNEFYGYPDEWFPSVSATIGDRYPERSFFMIFIAITSGPRFALVGLWYLLTRKPGSKLPGFIASMGLLRTLTCGGWTYITSTDDHDWHDILMISYIVATLPWTTGCIALSPANPQAIKYRKYLAGAFFGTLVPLIFFFIRHKVHRVAGAYTIYAFFEWALIIFDVAFDAVTAFDFDTFEVMVRDVKGSSKGEKLSPVPSAVLEKEKEKVTGGISSLRFTWTEALDTAANVYHGFIFWTMLTSLGLVVWYFPLWHMGISGYEAFVMVSVSPVLLVGSLRRIIIRNLRIVHLLSLAGVAAYLVTNPVVRLFTVGLGVALSTLGWVGTLYSESAHESRFESRLLGLLVGLILSSTAKFAWQTNNPVWPIMHAANGGWNATGLTLGILAALRFTRQEPPTSGPSPEGKQGGSALLAACGVGGLFFGLHSLLSDSSTMILWVWTGFPIRGPYFSTHGWCTVAVMSAGLFAGIGRPAQAGSWPQYAVGTLCAAVLTCFSHWTGYLGGLGLAAYLMAAAVPLIAAASKKSPAVTFGLGFFIYVFLVLFHVWVVAYAFVPGGPLVREHTDWIMLTTMALIGAGVFNFNASQPRRRQQQPRWSSPSQHRKYFGVSALVVNILFLCAAFRRFPTNDYKPYHGEDRVLTAGIWTIHFSLDNDMWSSEYRMRDLMKEMELDVVGVLESDLQRIIMGNRDTTQFLAEDLGMYVDYGPGPNKHTWGAALLSKFPIVESKHHLLPSPVGELAPAIHATLDVYGELVDVFVFHSGQEEDPEDRRLQSEYLAKLMGSTARPAILLSYLVTKPLEGNYNTYVGDKSGMHDVDPTDWDRWCEYILYKGLRRVGYARVSRSTITDTELQVGKFVIPKSAGEAAQLEARPAEERDRQVQESEVPDIAPNSGRIVSCSEDRNALVWEPSPTGYKPTLVLLRISRAATFVRWSPSETKFAVGSGDRAIAICYFEAENDWWVSKHLKKPIRSTITSVAWHPNSVLLAAGSTDAHARVFSSFIKGVDTKPDPGVWGERLPFNTVCGEFLNNSAGWVHSVSFSPSGDSLAFAAHDSSITVVYPSGPEQPPRAVLTISTQLLPFKSLIWRSEDEIIAAGYDCEAFRFKGGESGWQLAGAVDSNRGHGLGQQREESALNMFKQMDLRGKAKDDTQLKTIHQNTITTIRSYDSSGGRVTKFTSSGVDGRVVIWNA